MGNMSKILLSLLALLALSSGSPRTTTTSSPIPDVGADLQEVWDWLEGLVTDGTSDAAINVNMYMAYNQMSMENTVFTMNVDDDGNMSGSASASLDSTNPMERSFAWMRSGLGGQAGKALSVNMFMFNNTMSMKETIFTMDVANDE